MHGSANTPPLYSFGPAILPALYCYIEIAEAAEDLVAIPDEEMEFLLAKISDPEPMIMPQQQTPENGDTVD